VQELTLRYPGGQVVATRAHVGVVGSGDCEVLVEPHDEADAVVRVRTTVDGFEVIWQRVLGTFFARYPVAGRFEINDQGATPGVVSLRLRQAVAGTT
jgi:malonate decarboxylase acyl carrier protein